jgi:hypothetical protein
MLIKYYKRLLNSLNTITIFESYSQKNTACLNDFEAKLLLPTLQKRC